MKPANRRGFVLAACAGWSTAILALFVWGCVSEGGLPSFEVASGEAMVYLLYLGIALGPWMLYVLLNLKSGLFRVYGAWDIFLLAMLLIVLCDDGFGFFLRRAPTCLFLGLAPWLIHHAAIRTTRRNLPKNGIA